MNQSRLRESDVNNRPPNPEPDLYEDLNCDNPTTSRQETFEMKRSFNTYEAVHLVEANNANSRRRQFNWKYSFIVFGIICFIAICALSSVILCKEINLNKSKINFIKIISIFKRELDQA